MAQLAGKYFLLLPAELQILIIETALLSKYEPEDPLIRYVPPNSSTLVSQSLQFLTPLERSWECSSRREQLKKARLINSIFCKLLTPVIFGSLHISHNSLSIQRAQAIASSRLAYHVREIVVHQGGWLPATQSQDPSFSSFYQRVNSHRYRNDYPVGIHPKRAEKALYKTYIEEIESERSLEEGNDLSDFRAAMASLPNLVAFTILPYYIAFNDIETSWYTLKRCGLSYLPDPKDHAGLSWACQLANAVQPKALNCSRISYDFFDDLIRRTYERTRPDPKGYVKDPVNAFQTLDYLTYRWSVKRQPFQAIHRSWPSYVQFSNLTTLILQLGTDGEATFIESTQWQSLISGNRNPPLLPKLTRFELDIGCAIRVQEVCPLVFTFKSTLRHLALRNTGIGETRGSIPTQKHGCSEDSLLKALYMIYQQTRLETCIIDESCHDIKDWTSEGKPAPYLAERPSTQMPKFARLRKWASLEKKKMILAKVSEAVCRRREWALSLDIKMDLQAREEHPEDPALRFCVAPWEETQDIFNDLEIGLLELT